MSADVARARERLIHSVIRVLAAEHQDEDRAWSSAEVSYAGEKLALAARDLTRAVEALPEDERPVSWDAEPAPTVGGVA